ncbi:DUF5615 family PIN-like protein [Salinarimonas sp. NSM]|uniref:DUF5615 family PIN-like protein n=1 Tax=Salinarimonas sp. NSM TaxID=3458003 RepID=UPI004035C3F4
MKFYLDENVPRSVGVMLADAGYEVVLAKDVTGQGAADTVVCTVAEVNDFVLVSFDKDMRRAAQRQGLGSRARFRSLSLIKLCCFEPDAARRLASALTLVEHEWPRRAENEGRRIYVEIGTTVIRVNR